MAAGSCSTAFKAANAVLCTSFRHCTRLGRGTSPPPQPTPTQSTYITLKRLVETKWAETPDTPRPRVAWVTTNSSGVSFRLDPYKVTLIQVRAQRAARI
jgi:hypothetical protein